MAFREDLDAARMRAESLASEVERLTEANTASADELEKLRSDLAKARRDVKRLAALEPGSAARVAAPFRSLTFVSLGLILATAVAGYHSETVGISMSYFAGALLGFGLGGWIGALRFEKTAGAVGVALVAMCMLVFVLGVFYSSIWPSL